MAIDDQHSSAWTLTQGIFHPVDYLVFNKQSTGEASSLLLAGHASFATTKGYFPPEKHTILGQMEKARQAEGSTRIRPSTKALVFGASLP